jgi:DnaJ-class molecular chaperone
MKTEDSFELLNGALATLKLPVLISHKELKQRYKALANTHHPDFGGDEKKMAEINDAYKLLKSYMDNFKFSFSKEEIYKQFPQEDYVSRFRF